MMADAIALRPARDEDCQRIFEWANDPVTRRASFHSAAIVFEEHQRWYADSLAGERRHLRVAEVEAEPVGLVRFDRIEEQAEAAEIGINIAPEHRGRRLAVPLLRAASEAARSLGLRVLVARIRPDNAPSLAAFERAGYRFVAHEVVAGSQALRYEAVV